MLHGRVVWPQGQVAGGITPPKVISIDESTIKNIPGIVMVRRQNFVAVAAEREWDAVRAARQLKVEWEPFPAVFPGHDRIHDTFRAATTNHDVVVNTGNAETAFSQQGLRVVSASYRGPYESHGTMAPNCAVADVKADSALVMCSAQGIYQTRASVAGVTRAARRQGPGAVLRGLEHVRQQLLRRRGGSGGDHVAGTRQAGPPAVEPAGRIRLGQLRPGASRGDSRRSRCQRQDCGLRISGVGT